MNGHQSSSDFSSLVDLLRGRARIEAEQRAFTFLRDGEDEAGHLTYAELDLRARCIGALLQCLGVRGKRVLLLYPPGLEYIVGFFGCLYAGAIAVPAYPPRLNRLQPRLKAIVNDARPALALTTPALRALVEPLLADCPAARSMRWSAADDPPEAGSWQDPRATRDRLALFQYTSGSTAAPRGVMISHANLLDNAAHIASKECHSERPVGVFWLPPYHDMGLIGGIIQPAYYGGHSVLMSPLSFLQHPFRWLLAISRFKGTHSAAPNFAYELCNRRVREEQRTTLDLSTWRIAYNGAEPVRQETLETFSELFEPCGFRRSSFVPAYGLAEATLLVSAARKDRPPISLQGDVLEQKRVVEEASLERPGRRFVSCGVGHLDTKIVIADPGARTRCAHDQVGEIWVSGSGVARGYWNRPEESRETFEAYLADTREGPFLRTGDLGFLRDGELFVTGRLKDVVIINGRNHFAEDIEHTVQRRDLSFSLDSCAAFGAEVMGRERLVICVEVARMSLNDLDAEGLVRGIRRAVAEEHDVEAYAVLLCKPGVLSKTSSGKIQRYACRLAFLQGQLDVIGDL